eukprot:TRINITY_DN3739_c0_g1_i1.p1 TRINITY_DN3739_c0_g1~~TRINITY_DN3739_c0_g1_i1.p1  ORF type:complete len:570 (+),score=110.25 TRINITY_DN3739_c0_g1_i1:33-1712(+)
MANLTALDLRIKALEAQIVLQNNSLELQKKDFQTKVHDYEESLDTIWILLATTLVFFMHAGFSLLEAGSVRQKNAQNILAKNLMVVSVGFICWWLTGYAFGFGAQKTNPNLFSGTLGFFMDGIWSTKTLMRFWLFQGAFCATSATIVSGAMAERVQIKGFLTFTMIITLFIYPVGVYWGWSGNGFLYYTENGKSVSIVGAPLIDFAGSGLVHMVGGIAALCGATIVGPRKGRYDPDLQENFDGHNIPFCVLGTFCLWVGWYGFNPGSTGSMHDVATAHTAGLTAVNTTLAPCMSGLLVFFLRAQALSPKRLDVSGFCNGILAGLVGITAGCSVVTPGESIVIGIVAGFLYQGASMAMAKLQIDDVVDAFAVHGVNGCWGLLAIGFFGDPDDGNGGNGSFYGGSQLATQAFAVLVLTAWTAIPCIAIFAFLHRFGMLRLSDGFQDAGADFMEHSPVKAYCMEPVLAEMSKDDGTRSTLEGGQTDASGAGEKASEASLPMTQASIPETSASLEANGTILEEEQVDVQVDAQVDTMEPVQDDRPALGKAHSLSWNTKVRDGA